jgi:hypothetical protein
MFVLRSSLFSVDADVHPSLLGTIFDKDGKVSRQQFKKSDLCSEHGLDVRLASSQTSSERALNTDWPFVLSMLQPRDLRRVDSATPNLVPTIIVRQHAILATVLHIRALIKADTVVVFDVVGSRDSRLQSGFVDHLVVRIVFYGQRFERLVTDQLRFCFAEQPQDAQHQHPI